MRNLLTSLVLHGKVVTTQKRAKALCAEADRFFARLVSWSIQDDADTGKRVVIQSVKNCFFSDEAGKKVVSDLLPVRVSAKKIS
jgi:ribosomal protein L17